MMRPRRKMRAGAAALALGVCVWGSLWAAQVAAQSITPAERTELSQRLQALDAEVQAMRARLGGAAPAGGAAQQGDMLRRLESFETELRSLIATVEALEFAQRQAAAEAETRFRFLDDRLTLLEGGDIAPGGAPATAATPPAATPPAAAGKPPTRPGGQPPAAQPPAGQPPATSLGAPPTQLGAVQRQVPRAERAAFDAATQALETRGLRGGEAAMNTFLVDHPDSVLAGEAWRALGEAYTRAGRHQEAARAHLAGVRDHGALPGGPENLLGLAGALTELGRAAEACSAYAELDTRFPGAAPSLRARAQAGRSRAGC